jgi:hypothetical protein
MTFADLIQSEMSWVLQLVTFRIRYHRSLMVVRFHPGLRDDDGSTAQPFRTMQQTMYASKHADGLDKG